MTKSDEKIVITRTKQKHPLLPLRDTVVFPRNVSSLFVGREKSMQAVRYAMDHSRHLVLVTQKETETALPHLKDLFKIGVQAEILQLLKMPDGTFKILVEGLNRVSLSNIEDAELIQWALFDKVLDKKPVSEKEIALSKNLRDRIIDQFVEYNNLQDVVSHEYLEELKAIKDISSFTDTLAHSLPISFEQKQAILSNNVVLERMEMIVAVLTGQQEITDLEKSIQDRVREQMDRMQRSFYLNEQMKVIKEELGDVDSDEFEEYNKQIISADLPKEVKQKAEAELAKLRKMPPMSAESTVSRNFLDWIIDLPWNISTSDTTDMKTAEKVLEDSHHSLKKVKDRILEFIAVRQLASDSQGPILCLVGPPGVGKTSLAKSLADSLDRKFARIALGGVRDEAEIRGHRRTYIGAMPGRILSTLKKVGVKNPVILLDEIDKLSYDYRGNPAAALLEVLDPEQNQEFQDHYLEVPFDLSQVLFIATANIAENIPAALLDRLEVIQLPGYTEQEKIHITHQFLFPRQIKNSGIGQIDIHYNSKSIAFIIRHYTREAGVRQLERKINQIARKIARQFLSNQKENSSFKLDKKTITDLLGPKEFLQMRRDTEPVIGKAHGLAWTLAGGDILNIEVALAYGSGRLNITGNLGDVMKESANAALGFVRAQSHRLGLVEDFYEKNDIFLHVPEGAIPKDGPSAGITMTTAMISAVTQIPVRSDIAMTGEITLRGDVLPIGGLKEKTLAAFRFGIEQIIAPKENQKDLVEIPTSVRERVKIHFVSRLEEVLELALLHSGKIWKNPNTLPFYSKQLSKDGAPFS